MMQTAATMRLADAAGKALPKHIDFTVARLAAIKPTADPKGRIWVYDRRLPSLAYLVTGNGARSFYLVKRHAGRLVRMRLAGGELSVDDARQLAVEKMAEIAKGIDPMAARRKVRIEPTIKGLFAYYLEHYAKQHKKQRSWEDDEKQYNRYLPAWQGRRLSQINRGDVQALHAKIGTDNGTYAANRLLALLHKMFNVALDIGYASANPAHGVRKFRETSRARFVKGDELPRLMAAINEESGDFPDFFNLALWTGARRGNVQAMAWGEVNMDARTWTIPADKAKAHEPIVVPLSDPAMKILKTRLDARQGDNLWVFPSRGASGHLEEPKLAWKRILTRAGIADLRIHDLRRTMGSWQAATGASLSVIGKSLGHRNVATTAVYARLDLDPVRAAVDKAVAAMQVAVEVGQKKAGQNPPRSNGEAQSTDGTANDTAEN